MKHVKSVTKKTSPARAYGIDWFVNLKGGIAPGLITTGGKPSYVRQLWGSADSIDPTDVNDVGRF